MKQCQVEACERKYYAKGFCKLHYGHHKQYGRIWKDPKCKRQALICIVEGCNRKPRAKGYCTRHYFQINKFGEIIGNSARSVRDRNEYLFTGDICRIKLYNKLCEEIAETVIDADDYEKVKDKKWFFHQGYATSGKIRLTHVIYNRNEGMVIDHVNHDTLDNRKVNLRICSHGQNLCNAKTRKDNTSGYRGVSWDKEKQKWMAKITYGKKQIVLGRYATKKEAAKAYNVGAKKHHGEFACLNVIP